MSSFIRLTEPSQDKLLYKTALKYDQYFLVIDNFRSSPKIEVIYVTEI